MFLLTFGMAIALAAQSPQVAPKQPDATRPRTTEAKSSNTVGDGTAAEQQRAVKVETTKSNPQTREDNREPSKDDRAVTYSTVVIAIFTVALAIVGWLQWKVLERHGKTMKGQLAAATTLANAAKQSADTATQALHTTQRAFVLAGELIPRSFTPGEVASFSWQISNVGMTPGTMIECGVGQEEMGLPPAPNYLAQPPQPPVVIGPHLTYHLPITLQGGPLTPQRHAALLASPHGIAFYTRIRYRDEFQNEHVTRSALIYFPQAGRVVVPDNPAYFESS